MKSRGKKRTSLRVLVGGALSLGLAQVSSTAFAHGDHAHEEEAKTGGTHVALAVSASKTYPSPNPVVSPEAVYFHPGHGVGPSNTGDSRRSGYEASLALEREVSQELSLRISAFAEVPDPRRFVSLSGAWQQPLEAMVNLVVTPAVAAQIAPNRTNQRQTFYALVAGGLEWMSDSWTISTLATVSRSVLATRLGPSSPRMQFEMERQFDSAALSIGMATATLAGGRSGATFSIGVKYDAPFP